MRYILVSLGLTVAPAVIGIALYLNDRPYLAAAFFAAAVMGALADAIKIGRAMRGRRP